MSDQYLAEETALKWHDAQKETPRPFNPVIAIARSLREHQWAQACIDDVGDWYIMVPQASGLGGFDVSDELKDVTAWSYATVPRALIR